MTPVLMEFLTSTGAPLGFAGVEIRLTRSDYQESIDGVLMPRLINGVTGLDGKLLVRLMPSNERYHVTVYDTITDAALHHHFYVPIVNNVDYVARLQDLIVPDDFKLSAGPYDAGVLQEILAAKANTFAARDAAAVSAAAAEAAAQFADDSIQVTEDARDVSVAASLTSVAARDIAVDKAQHAHDDALLAEDRAAAALQSATYAMNDAAASLASATASAASALAGSNSAYEADLDAAAAASSRDVATSAAADAHHDALVAENARIVSLGARDVALNARDVAVLKADQLSSQLYSFNEIYIGKFTAAPATDGNGNPLKVGAIYENTVEGKIYQWESDLAWHAYDEESQLQLNNATLAASNAAASAQAALQRMNTALQASLDAGTYRDLAVAANVAAQDAAVRSYQDQLVSTASKDVAVAAKDTATSKAAAASQSAADAAASATLALQAQVQTDWTLSDPASKAFIKNKPLLSAVATSGNKADVGLGNVDNTADTAKPVSQAQQAALNLKENLSNKNGFDGYPGMAGYKIALKNQAGTVISYLNSVASALRIWNMPDKDGTVALLSDITGLNSGNNTGDETQASILGKLGIPSISGTNTGDQTAASLGLGNVNNTADLNKPISYAMQAALDAKAAISYVDTKIAALVDSSPAALDTLKELATALGNDANFAATTAAALGNRPTLVGAGAYGTWGISIQGSAASVAVSDGINRDANSALVNPIADSGKRVRYDFINAIGTGEGNYAGLMSFSPWDGSTQSTGGNSYQMAFCSTSMAAGGMPILRLRKGIDTAWDSWFTMLHSGNAGAYAPSLTGAGASGIWAIDITGRAAKASQLAQNGGNGVGMTFNWQGNATGIQPTWLWGGNDGQNMYVYNPANFSVANANTLANCPPDMNGTGSTIAQRDAAGVVHASAGGFGSETYAINARNPIWRFMNAQSFGMSYFQGTSGRSTTQDGIAMHFGTGNLTGATAQFYFQGDGVAFFNQQKVLTAADYSNDAVGSTLARRDGNGDLMARYINTTDDTTATAAITGVIVKKGDNYHRTTAPTPFKAWLNVNGADIYQDRADLTFDVKFAKELRWNNYGNGHSIFDASQGIAPNGAAIDRVDSQIRWSSTYPTIMGWNGQATYGVRVDRAAYAENLTSAVLNRIQTAAPNYGSYGSIGISGSTGGYAGISFSDYKATFMVNDVYSGIYLNDNTWAWRWDNGVLGAGIIPVARLSGLNVYPRLTTDFNSVSYRTTGFYAAEGAPANGPGGAYNSMIVAGNGDVGLQIVGGYTNDSLWFRGWWAGGGSYGAWRTLIHNGNIGSYAAGSAPRLTGPANTNGTDGWFRSQGSCGWYNETYATGFFSQEGGIIRTYNNARIISCQGTATAPAYAFSNDTDTGMFSMSDGNLGFAVDSVLRVYISGSTLVCGGDIAAFSDPRRKKNWVKLPADFIERWAKVQAGTYERIDTGDIQVGLNAKDVQAILPEATPEDHEGMLTLAYGQAAAVATVQLAERVVKLEELLMKALARIEALENQ